MIQAPNTHIITEKALIKAINQLDISAPNIISPARNLLKLSCENNYILATVKTYCAFGYIYTYQAQYELARNAFLDGLKLFPKIDSFDKVEHQQRLYLQLQGGLGNTYAFQALFIPTLPHYYNALKTAEDLGDAHQASNYLSNIGAIHFMNQNKEEALEFYIRAKDLKIKHNLHMHLDVLLSNIASCFLDNKDYPNAIAYLEEALQVASRTKSKNAIAIIYTGYADYYLRTEEYEQGIQYIEEAIILCKELKNNQRLMRTYIMKGRLLKEQKKYTEGVIVLEKALEIGEAANINKDLEEAYSLLSDFNKDLKNYEKAYYFLEKYSTLNKEIVNEKTQKTIAGLNLKYDLEKKDFEIHQLQQKQELLQSKNEELKLFASKASHDMKEPLRMIGSFSNLLQRRYANKLDQRAMEYLGIIEDANGRMSQLLDDLLSYTIAGTNTKKKELISLNEIVFLVQQNLQLMIKEKGAVFEIADLPPIKAHQTDMLQLFQNLISNALKFCKETVPHIRIKLEELEEEWKITVQDNGIGIAIADQERIFGLLTRLHSRQEFEGTGIGLAICKKIVDQYNGKIWIESEVGKGTSFFFTLPKN